MRTVHLKGDDSAPLLYSCESTPEVLHPVLGPPTQGGHGTLGAGPEEGNEDGQRVEHVSCGDRLRELGLRIVAFHYLKGAYRKSGEGLL